MTEYDTFLKLKKPTLDGLRDLINEYSEDEWIALGDTAIDEWMESWGWTYTEYVREMIKYHKRV